MNELEPILRDLRKALEAAVALPSLPDRRTTRMRPCVKAATAKHLPLTVSPTKKGWLLRENTMTRWPNRPFRAGCRKASSSTPSSGPMTPQPWAR